MKIEIELTPVMQRALEELIEKSAKRDRKNGLNLPPLTIDQAAEVVLVSGLIARGYLKDSSDVWK